MIAGTGEPTASRRFLDLTFGMTEGWWNFTDRDVRGSSALVDADAWRGLLGAGGFGMSLLLLCLNLFFLINGLWIGDSVQLLLFAPLFTPILGDLALKFGAYEFFWLAVFGVLIFTTLSNVFTQNNLSSSAQSVAKGLIIVVAVLLQQRLAQRSNTG